jgi:hypothetical protein
MNWKDVKESGRGLIFRYYPNICLQELVKLIKNLSQDNRFPGRDLNPWSPKYDAVVLITQPTQLNFNTFKWTEHVINVENKDHVHFLPYSSWKWTA